MQFCNVIIILSLRHILVILKEKVTKNGYASELATAFCSISYLSTITSDLKE